MVMRLFVVDKLYVAAFIDRTGRQCYSVIIEFIVQY